LCGLSLETEMRRYNLRLSAFSLSTLVLAVIYTPTNSDAWDTSSFGSMGDVDWSKRSYPGYAGADSYSAMGDVDWGKRGVGAARSFAINEDNGHNKDKRARGLYRSWLSRGNAPAYQYHSMADTDWGWKKRGVMSNEDDHELPNGLYHNYLMKKARGGYKHRPYYGYSTRNYRYITSPYVSASRSRSVKRPRNSNFHSMADMDWGWKRKKRTGMDLLDNSAESSDDGEFSDEDLDELMDLISQNNDATEDVSKRNIGSFLKNHDKKRSIASLARSDEVPNGKRSSLNEDQEHDLHGAEDSTLSDPSELQMDKRNIASVAREFYGSYKPGYTRYGISTRGGLSSLARNGGIRNKIMRTRNREY